MKKYYIINPEPDINSLCISILDVTSFHSQLTLVDSGKGKQTVSGWEVTPRQLAEIYRCARDKGIPLKNFRVATPRTLRSEDLRLAQKREYVAGYQSQNKRPQRLKQILAERGLDKK